MIARVVTGREVTAGTLLGVCTSLKPASGRAGQSATRSILCYALETLSPVYRDVLLLDLRDHPLPFFDGRTGPEYGNPNLDLVSQSFERVHSLLLSVPAYWCGVSGVFKNLVDTLCGATYDLPPPRRTVLTNKHVGLLVVGADEQSAVYGAQHAIEIIKCTGAMLADQPVIVANPRDRGLDTARLSRELIPLAAILAAHARKATSLPGPE